MVRIAICDDDIKELHRTQVLLEHYANEHSHIDFNISSFIAPLELLYTVEKSGSFDIVFLDIYMSGMLGTDAAKQLRQLGDHAEIIFVTTSRDHAFDAFEVDAAQYLVKPYSEKSFFNALNKVMQRLNVERRHMITLKTSQGIVRIFSRNVIFTETSRNNYQIIHTINHEPIEVRMTATELNELLVPAQSFVRCGASMNINLRFIRQITKDAIIFDTGLQRSYPYRSYQKLKDDFLSFQMSSLD